METGQDAAPRNGERLLLSIQEQAPGLEILERAMEARKKRGRPQSESDLSMKICYTPK